MVKKALRIAAGAVSLVAVGRLFRRGFALGEKVVLISGGSRGLGLVLARALVKRGAKVALCGRDEGSLSRARADLAGRGGDVFTFACDVGNREDVERLVAAVRERFGRIDALINNAGTIQVGPVETMEPSDYEEALRIHFWGPLHATLAVLPEMKARKAGRIVNISSFGGKVSVPHLVPYSASKFALVGFSEGLTAELAKDGVRVTTVCPGLMRTGSPRNAFFKGKHKAEYAWFKLGDSVPGLSISAESAAERIVQAMERGEAEVILSLPAKLAVWVHGLFPGFTADALAWVNRLLPKPGGIGKARAKGKESESIVTRSWVTSLTQQAEMQNNEWA